MNWKDKFVLVIGIIGSTILAIYILSKALSPATHSPTDLMTNPEKNSFIGESYED